MEFVSERTGDICLGKASVDTVALGLIGLAAGALGKKKTTYRCSHCGFTIEQ